MLQGCLDNLSSAQEALYNRFSPRMLGVCYRYAHNREDAEDMLQEGFIKVYSQIHQYKGSGAPIGYRTVLNLYAIEGFSHKEISTILEIEESTSRSQYTRARALLEEILIKKKILQKPRENVRMISMK